jgi:flagellar protein FliO/FliZ
MSQSLLPVVLFVVVLACIPWALKWFKQRGSFGHQENGDQARLISVLALGPNQRVVTVEVGQKSARQRLTLGVSSQSITCLHTEPVNAVHPQIQEGS